MHKGMIPAKVALSLALFFFLTGPTWAGDDRLTLAMAAYAKKDFEGAEKLFQEILKEDAQHGKANYFMGEIFLQKKQLPEVITHWRKYLQLEPDAAVALNVPKRLTLVETEVRKEEFQRLLQNEEKISKSPPEPNTIAVFPFSNTGDEKYNVLSKGLTAIIISDLAKVPGLKVLERQNVQALMEEVKLSKTNLVEKDSRVRASRLLKAEKLVMGDFAVK